MRLRPAKSADAGLLYRWRTDPGTVAASFSPPPDMSAHRLWFRRARLDPYCRIYIAETDEPVGMVRFNARADSTADLSIIVAPAQRGRGIGTDLLKMATAHYIREEGAGVIHARVRPDNEASLRMFRSAGYREMESAGEAVLFAYAKEEG